MAQRELGKTHRFERPSRVNSSPGRFWVPSEGGVSLELLLLCPGEVERERERWRIPEGLRVRELFAGPCWSDRELDPVELLEEGLGAIIRMGRGCRCE